MVELNCILNHQKDSLCDECQYILNYAFDKLSNCPFGIEKPTCLNCKIHCFHKEQREKIKEIMRFSGPKMIFHHPYLAVMHIIDNKIVQKQKPHTQL
jgi:hypothetical protein